MASKKSKRGGAWTCPECGVLVPNEILLCDCGYHRQTRRNLEEEAENQQASAREPPDPIKELEAQGAATYPWLARGSRLTVLLAYLTLLVAGLQLWSAIEACAAVDAGPGTKEAVAASTAFLFRAATILVAGATSFVVLRSLAEAARALLAASGDLQRRVASEAEP